VRRRGADDRSLPPRPAFSPNNHRITWPWRIRAGDPGLFSIRTFAADIVAFIEAHRLDPIIVGGISMGAASTLHIAVHWPELVRGLILVRPAWIAASTPANNGPNREVGRLLADLSQQEQGRLP